MTPPSVGKTQGDIASAVYSWLKVSTRRLPGADLTDIINMARKDISRKYKLNYSESTYSFSTVVNLATYALPDDFSQPYLFRYLDSESNKWVFLRYKAYDDFMSKGITGDEELVGDDAVAGAPEEYTWWQRNLILRPTPTAIIPMYFDYFSLYSEMATAGLYDSLTMYAWDVLLFKCLEYASRYLLEDQRALIWEAKAEATMMDLSMDYSRAKSAARIPQAQEYGSYLGTGRHHEYWWYFF
jgi:hypothetical protein